MIRRLMILSLTMLLSAGALCAQSYAADSAAVAAFVLRHEAAVVSGDTGLLRADYGPTTLWISSTGVRRIGRDAILQYFARLFADSGKLAARAGRSDSVSVLRNDPQGAVVHVVVHPESVRVAGVSALPSGRGDVELFLSKNSDGWTIEQEVFAMEKFGPSPRPGTIELIGSTGIVQSGCDQPRFPKSVPSSVTSGHVVVEYVVGANGHLEAGRLEVVSSTDARLDDAARAAVLSCSFKPAKFFGTPIRRLLTQGVSFERDGVQGLR